MCLKLGLISILTLGPLLVINKLSSGQGLVAWEQTSLRGPRVSDLLFAPDGDLFAAQFFTGIFRSRDNGDSWTQLATQEDLGGNDVLTLALNSEGHLFAGTTGNGIYRSTDNGVTWSHLALNGTHVPDLLIYKSQEVEYLVAAAFQAMRSNDGGITWTKLLDVEPSYRAISLAVGPEGALYVGTNGPAVEPNFGILYRSADNGQTWKNLGFTGPAYVVVPGRDGSIYVGGAGGIAYLPNVDTPKWEFLGPVGLDDLLEFSRDTLFAATIDGVMLSTDRGRTWSDWLTDTSGASLAISPDGALFAGTTTGVFRTVGPLVTSLERRDTVPELLILESAYPNPFHDVVTLSCSLKHTSTPSLRIYDVLGREVASVLPGPVFSGQNTVRWNAGALAAGIYFARLESLNSTASNYLTLVKR